MRRRTFALARTRLAENEADMKQLIYRSQPFGFDRAMLAGILMGARRNNTRDDITGALIVRHDMYLQLIEARRPRSTPSTRASSPTIATTTCAYWSATT